MAWDSTWEKIYRSTGYNRYPSEEVIGFVLRNFGGRQDRHAVRILELGCGQGANLWFLALEGFDTYGIDAAETGIKLSQQVLGAMQLSAELTVGDIENLDRIYPASFFDAVIDMGCLQHNLLPMQSKILEQIHGALKPGGKMFSRMMQEGTYGDGLGVLVAPKAYKDIQEGPLRGWGLIQLCNYKDVTALFDRFSEVHVEESLRSVNDRKNWAKRWVITATKSE